MILESIQETAQATEKLRQALCEHSSPNGTEVDLQDLYENHNYSKALEPEEFSTDRGWWFSCRTCGGNTRVRTRHPYCRHCGFSPQTTIQSKRS